jgi:hypothetical protein
MKPNANSGRAANLPLTPFAIAKSSTIARVVAHPLSKKAEESSIAPPDEETLLRLNAMARQYPFCIRHRTNNFSTLL